MTTKRGDGIPRPKPWAVRAVDLAAGKGWDKVVAQFPEAADRAWVAMTSDPRRIDRRQHQLKGTLGRVAVAGTTMDQWQCEVTGAGRVWNAIDDAPVNSVPAAQSTPAGTALYFNSINGNAISTAIDCGAKGMNVALVEKGPLGGTCPHRGCIPSKLLIGYADAAEHVREAQRFGFETTVRTGASPIPIERTLLTTGMLEALLISQHDKNRRVETPHLAVAYKPTDWPHATGPIPRTVTR